MPGAGFGMLFVFRQRRLTSPLSDLRVFGTRTFSVALGIMLLGTVTMGGIILFVTLYLQMVEGLSPLQARLWLVPSALGVGADTMLAPLSRAGSARHMSSRPGWRSWRWAACCSPRSTAPPGYLHRLQAHGGDQGGEVGARQDPPRAGCPGRVNRAAPMVEQHPETRDRLPEGAGSEAHLGEVFSSEGNRDRGRAIFR